MLLRLAVLAAVAALFVPTVYASVGSAPPVGPLPTGQITSVSTPSGTLIAVALPGQSSRALVWRLARKVNGNVLREVSERNVGRDVIVIYRAVRPGSVVVAYGLTKGETRKAYKSVTYNIRIH